jgi:hypothetical protein
MYCSDVPVVKYVRILFACSSWPFSKARLHAITNQIYHLANAASCSVQRFSPIDREKVVIACAYDID